MDLSASFSSLNYWALFTSSLLTFLIGGLWYSPLLFGKLWQRENKLSDQELRKGSPAPIFIGSFFLALVAALNLALFLGPKSDWSFGLTAGLLTGLGWVATAFGTTYLFERKSFKLFAVNAGYHSICLALMGLILGTWK